VPQIDFAFDRPLLVARGVDEDLNDSGGATSVSYSVGKMGTGTLRGGERRGRLGRHRLLGSTEELIDGEAVIGRDLPEQSWRDVATGVKRHGRLAPVGMAELLVRPSLANLDEAVHREEATTSRGLRTGARPISGDGDLLDPDELDCGRRFAVLQYEL